MSSIAGVSYLEQIARSIVSKADLEETDSHNPFSGRFWSEFLTLKAVVVAEDSLSPKVTVHGIATARA